MREKQDFKRNNSETLNDYPQFENEFGHLEGDTIVGVHRKAAVIRLTERISKSIISLKPNGHKAQDIETTGSNVFQEISFNPLRLIIEKSFPTGKTFEVFLRYITEWNCLT